MPEDAAAYSGSQLILTLEYFWTIRRFEMILDATTTLTDNSETQFLRKNNRTASRFFHKHIPETKLSGIISRTASHLLRQSNPETQLSAIASRTTFGLPTEIYCSQMHVGYESTQARHHTASDNVQDTPTRRSTERCTARLVQGRPSLARSQTCQRNTPPPVPRR